MRTTITAFVLLAFSSPAFGQIKVEGPKEGTVGYRVKAKLTVDVSDMKLKCFPANDDWMGVTDFEGQKWIDFVPGKKILGKEQQPKLFTFVVAGNKAGKTYLETWEVTVSPDGEVVPPAPVPVPPGPEPTDELYKTLRAAYMVNPAAAAKPKLIGVYEQLSAQASKDSFKNFREAGEWLSKATPLAVGTDLQPVRDAVAEYLVANVSRQGSAWDKNLLVAALRRVIDSLKAIPA